MQPEQYRRMQARPENPEMPPDSSLGYCVLEENDELAMFLDRMVLVDKRLWPCHPFGAEGNRRMNLLRSVFRSIFVIPPLACLALVAVGFVLALADGDRHRDTFLSYRIPGLDLHYWILAELLLLGANGIALLKFAFLQGEFHAPPPTGWGTWTARFPLQNLRLLAANMIAISFLLLAFYVIRSSHF